MLVNIFPEALKYKNSKIIVNPSRVQVQGIILFYFFEGKIQGIIVSTKK